MPDTGICLAVMPSEATKNPQAFHLKYFKTLGMSFQSRSSFTTMQQNGQCSSAKEKHLSSKCKMFATPGHSQGSNGS